MSEIIDRIKQIIVYKSISERQFCKEIGVANGFLSKVSDVGCAKLNKILYAYPELNPIWLLTGEGKMLCKPNDAGASVQHAEPTIIYRDNPDKDEIIQLLRDKVKLLEQNAKQSSPQLGFYAQRQSSGSPAAEDPAMIAISSPKKPQKEDKNV